MIGGNQRDLWARAMASSSTTSSLKKNDDMSGVSSPKYNSRPQLVVVLSIVIFVAISWLNHSDLEWNIATLNNVGGSDLISEQGILKFRFLTTCFTTLTTTVYFFNPTPFSIATKYLKESSLKPKVITLKGMSRCATFTVWSWCLLTLYFWLATCASYSVVHPQSYIAQYYGEMARCITWVLFEISFGVSIQITLVVTFVLIPMIMKLGGPHDFFCLRQLIMHNLNVFFMITELLLNKVPVHLHHLPFSVLWGCLYVLFAWIWQLKKGVYFYPFLDHTLPWKKAVSFYLGLVVVLAVFHVAGVVLSSLTHVIPLTYRIFLLYSFVYLITKFR
jgi:hypothetical protein